LEAMEFVKWGQGLISDDTKPTGSGFNIWRVRKKSVMPLDCRSRGGGNPVVSSTWGFPPSREWPGYWLFTGSSHLTFWNSFGTEVLELFGEGLSLWPDLLESNILGRSTMWPEGKMKGRQSIRTK
jgi:hypothetical protein